MCESFKVSKLILALFLTLIFLPGIVLAQTTRKAEIVRDAIQARKENIATKVADRKELFEEKRLQIASDAAKRRETLKTKLTAIKDRKKVTIAERVDANLTKVNQTRTDAMIKHLDSMDALVDRLETRVSSVSAVYNDEVKSEIVDSRSKIDVARAAVQIQVSKTYPVTITTEDKLRVEFQAARDALHTDLKSVHGLVIEARKSIADILQTIAALKGENSGQ